MRMIFKNRLFMLAAFFCILQQVFVGLSTFIIGSAGVSLAEPSKVLLLLGAFFGSSAMAYLVGTCFQWLTARLANSLWQRYTHDLLSKLGKDIGYASPANKILTNTWMTGEAQSTLDSAAHFTLDFLSVTCNVMFTLAAFLAILGPLITSSVVLALICSFALLLVARRTIGNTGSKIQNSKIAAFLSVQGLWDQIFFGNQVTCEQPMKNSERNMSKYFKLAERYRLFEQGVFCLPIFLSMAVLYAAVAHQIHSNAVVLAALVAVLPRSLQLFQNVHTMSTYSSQFLLMRSKLINLAQFSRLLERREIGEHINKSAIAVHDMTHHKILSVNELLSRLGSHEQLIPGRVCIRGPNGAGKSSLLRDLKALLPQAVLVGPGIHLLSAEIKGSTGQVQKESLLAMMNERVPILLADEWDANLDLANVELLDQRISEFAKEALLIEVRHQRFTPQT